MYSNDREGVGFELFPSVIAAVAASKFPEAKASVLLSGILCCSGHCYPYVDVLYRVCMAGKPAPRVDVPFDPVVSATDGSRAAHVVSGQCGRR
jgi:hypothetical protein